MLKRSPIKRDLYAHGKLLLTGEYAVLDGTKALAIPLKYGQRLKVNGGRGCDIVWEAMDDEGEQWFKARISLYDFKAIKTSCEETADNLTELLTQACNLNSDFLSTWKGMKVKTTLDFPRHYGWGSSSTLVYLVAEWADIEPFDLMKKLNHGSGYDIACANASGPIIYQNKDAEIQVSDVEWKPDFLDSLYIVHQGEKQNSREAIKAYRKKKSSDKWLAEVESLTEEFLEAEDIETFEQVLNAHESLLSARLDMKPVKERLFQDYWGAAKSLGAWGGDFALVTSDRSEDKTRSYFQEKGFDTVMRLDSVLLTEETAEVS